MDTRETPAAKATEAAAPPERTQRHMCFSNIENFPYPGRNVFSTDWPVLPIVIQKQRDHTWSIRLLPERFSMPQISFQIKNNMAKTSIGARLNVNLRRKMTQSIYISTRYGNENSSMMLKEKGANYQYIIKLNQKQCFALPSAKRVAVFQASLKVVREDASAQLSNKDNICLTSQGSKHL